MNLRIKSNHFPNRRQPTIMCSSRESIATMLSKYVLKKREIKPLSNVIRTKNMLNFECISQFCLHLNKKHKGICCLIFVLLWKQPIILF